MVASDELGHGVSLSPRLRHILLLAVSQSDHSGATLTLADAILRRCSNEELNELLSVFEDAQPLSTGNGLTTDRWELNEEFFALRDYWGGAFEISLLLEADEQGLRTHCRAAFVQLGQGFETADPPNAKSNLASQRWQRITVDGAELLNGKVAARCVSDDGNTNVVLFDPATIVRPQFMSGADNAGRRIPTPVEHRIVTEQWNDFDDAMSRIERRVKDRLVGIGRPVSVVYAAYRTDGRDVPLDNLDEFAIQGKAILIAETKGFYGGDGAKSYESPVVENPTWLDLCVLANDMIETSHDHHHVFLEDVSIDEEASSCRTDGVKVYRFEMGS